jgi:hypothetical protein
LRSATGWGRAANSEGGTKQADKVSAKFKNCRIAARRVEGSFIRGVFD